LFLLVSFSFFEVGFNTDFILADESFKVLINEICWMGTEKSSSNEWIELYNNTGQVILLEGWGVYEKGGEVLIEPLTGKILAKSYYLIERTDETTVDNVPASQEPSGWAGYGLKNDGEHFQLRDNNSKVIDEINCSDGWFAGDNKTKQTMERKNPELSGNDPENWQTSENPGGTPKAKNSSGAKLRISELRSGTNAAGEVEPPTEIQPLNVYPSGIAINEVLPSPEGPDAENEWIEIFNENSIEVDISGWKISDTVGSIKSYTFPKGTKISSKGFLLFNRTKTKITLNNSEEGIKIFNPNGKIVDEINFGKAPLGQSYNKFDSQWQWSENLTPGSVNIASEIKEKTDQTFSTQGFEEKGSPLSGNLKSSASLSEVFQKKTEDNRDKFSPMTIALIIAVCSGIIILILKKKLKTN